MAMRMNGLMSGMDTESVVKELVAVRQTKVDKTKKAQTKHEWKQDAWKGLNEKLKKLMNKTLGNMRFTSAYAKKKTVVSDSSAASVITGEGAMNGVQSLKINKLARTAYLTGNALPVADPRPVLDEDGIPKEDEYGNPVMEEVKYDALTKLSDIKGLGELADKGGEFTITNGNKKVNVAVDSNTTISDVLNKLKDAGLNASFDVKNQRFFVSAKESGDGGNFSITASANDTEGMGDKALQLLGIGYDPDDASKDYTANYVKGENAEIELNGAKFTNNTNTFEINGLTITALNADPSKEITVTTKDDTDGIYDMIRNFFKEYNEIINEMDKLYNADSAKGYEPLTNEEKDSMSDTEVEEWEKKIKDSILRKDSNLSSVSSAMKTIMMEGVEMGDGKKMYLSEFGIETLGYFLAADNEKNAYHIAGDPDDAETSGNADKLKSAIANDPEKVISFFTGLANNLYKKMNDLSSSVEGYRSFGNFYDDKKMKSDYDDYKKKIKEQEKKLADYEDKWYKKFASMETALAKLQSKTSAITGMLGGGN